MSTLKKVLLFLMSAYLANTFIQHGWEKFDVEGFWTSSFVEKWGYGLYFMYFIGVVEFVGGIGILIPKISKYAALTLAIVMLGAMITRIIFGTSLEDVIWIGSTLVTLLYISLVYGMEAQLPIILKKLRNKKS